MGNVYDLRLGATSKGEESYKCESTSKQTLQACLCYGHLRGAILVIEQSTVKGRCPRDRTHCHITCHIPLYYVRSYLTYRLQICGGLIPLSLFTSLLLFLSPAVGGGREDLKRSHRPGAPNISKHMRTPCTPSEATCRPFSAAKL